MTSEGLAFSEFGESAFCVYLSGSQERAGRSLSLISSRPRLQAAYVGYEQKSNSDEWGGWWQRGEKVKNACHPFIKTSIH